MLPISPKSLPLILQKRSQSEKKLQKVSFTPIPVHSDVKKAPQLKLSLIGGSLKPPSLTSRNNGSEGRLDFFESFKNLPKHTQRNHYKNLEISPKQAYLEDINKRHLNPNPFGMFTSREPENAIDLHCFSMGDAYAHALSEGLKHFKTLESLNLRSNRLSEKGTYQILSNLESHPVQYLSLSNNTLGERAFDCILSILRSAKPYLKHLVLENTRISVMAINSLANILCSNQSLTYLSLAKNNLQTKSAKVLKEMLHYNNQLKRLDLHWNCLRAEGLLLILEGISENTTLLELDISWNAIGNNKDLRMYENISQNLSRQKYLLHLDLSHNYISHQESEVLANGLVLNHTLTGLHIAGNECSLDSKGFIVSSSQTQLDQGHFFKRIIGSPQYIHSTRLNCWICEHWKEVTFYWRPAVSGKAVSEPIFLHLECDEFKPELMESHKGIFILKRAVPSGTSKFFFSYMTSPMCSKEYKTESLDSPLELEIEYWEGCIVPVKLFALNYIDSNIDKNLYAELENVKPRTIGLKYQPPEEELIRIPWSIGISLFKDYKFTDSSTITDCFEFDWNMSRLQGFIKIPLHQVQIKEILLGHYSDIIETYRALSSYSTSEIYSVGSNIFVDFLNECSLIDSLYGPSDIGVNWSASKVPKEKNQLYNSGNGLIRYEFLEILVRVANDRYVRNKVCGNLVDAVKKIFSEHLGPVIKNYEKSTWRDSEYLVEEVDLVFKAHKPILDHVFKRYSGRKAVPGQKRFMSLEEFRELCRDAKIVSDKSSLREVDLAFISAMMLQIDEVFKKKHVEMAFVEFLEALARICNYVGEGQNYVKSEKDEIQEMYTSRLEPKLTKKIEDKMPGLLKLCPQALKENFIFPTTETYKRMMYKSSLQLNNLNSGLSMQSTLKSPRGKLSDHKFKTLSFPD